MNKEVILVPQDKCPMDILAEMGEKTRNAWIFFHHRAKGKLYETADDVLFNEEGFFDVSWEKTEEHPETNIKIQARSPIWSKVYEIKASDIAFTISPDDPDEIIFLKMEE